MSGRGNKIAYRIQLTMRRRSRWTTLRSRRAPDASNVTLAEPQWAHTTEERKTVGHLPDPKFFQSTSV